MAFITTKRIDSLRHEFGQADDNFFMLDENLSHLALREIAGIFGPSSHVRLEDLEGPGVNDETHIWPYMVLHRYKAILTADNDFKPISIRHRGRLIQEFGSVAASGIHTPVVIHMAGNPSRQDLLDTMRKHAGEIMQVVRDNDCAYVCITDKGLERHESDDGLVERHIKWFPPRSCSSLRPSSGHSP